ncbi:hypothetical protein Val02_41850 [Virgisporangium aliadipatigenens]|uniref:LPXTG cell wall anchor domain-containing protein n=1 Tax=Virgisporangium aliadipatigenens TaxID=741659 RepID=A0A8J3YKY6_9ACTN|nr:hypothetical protein Val02_41850 [Virgisporangium aliadipatigenens]
MAAAAGAVLAAAGLFVGVGTPAQAAPGDHPYVFVGFLNNAMTIPAGTGGRTVHGSVYVGDAIAPRVHFDWSGVAGIVSIRFPATCTTTGTRTACAFPDVLGADAETFDLPLVVTAKAGAGAKGQIKTAVEAKNLGERFSPPITVNVADGVDLVMHEFGPERHQLTPADTMPVTAVIDNVGNRTADGVRVSYTTRPGTVPPRYDNCTYQTYQAICDLDVALEPGYTLTVEPFVIGFAPDAWGDKGVWTYADALAESDAAALRARGTGGKRLTGAATRSASVRAARELNTDDNGSEWQAEVANQIDIAAVGATASGTAGSTVTVTVGARNVGKGTRDISRSGGEPAWRYWFEPPTGTEVVTVSQKCVGIFKQPDGSYEGVTGKPGAPLYQCEGEPNVFPVGTTFSVPFGLKINEVIPDAKGRVTFDDPLYDHDEPVDDNSANDTAQVVINPTRNGGGGGGGGGGGSLPITGTNAAIAGGAGAVLVAVGVGLFVAFRRRRIVLVTPEH